MVGLLALVVDGIPPGSASMRWLRQSVVEMQRQQTWDSRGDELHILTVLQQMQTSILCSHCVRDDGWLHTIIPIRQNFVTAEVVRASRAH